MEFRLLGEFEVWHDGTILDLGGPRQRAVLAALLLRPNTVATVNYLCEAVWRRLPASPATNLRTYVTGLRRRLSVAGADTRLRTHPGGYSLTVHPDELDVQVFQDLLDAASAAQQEGHQRTALERLDQALALWRSHNITGIADSPVLEAERSRLEELRFRAIEARCTAMIELGQHKEASIELRRLAAEHPLREELWANLITALQRDGRRAEALDAFATARANLVGELGIEPGEELRRRQQEVLETGEPAPPADIGNPHQLPMDITEFTGREDELRRVFQAGANLETTAIGVPTAVPVVVITGPAGIGKTRLAVHAAHQLVHAGRFDEIQLWADLAGADQDRRPADPDTVLDGFLLALRVPPPPDPALRAALYRDRIAGHRAVVVLDDAATAEQVLPLLPGDPSCLVLITSRYNLVDLDGARHVELDMFSTDEAVSLLAKIAGRDRIAAEPAGARQLVELCDRLPLAVALAARRLQTRPRWRVGALAAKLAAAGSRLDELDGVSGSVSKPFEASYQALDPAQRRLFRLLGAHLPGDVTGPAAAALADLPVPRAGQLLEELLDAHLLHQRVPGRYRMHNLVRLHARLHTTEEDGDAPFTRLLRHYLGYAERAVSLMHPNETRRIGLCGEPCTIPPDELVTQADAVAWLRMEHANLVVAARRGSALRPPVALLAIRLAIVLYRPLINLGATTEHVKLYQLVARAAKRIDARRAEAQALEDLGTVLGQRGRLAESVDHSMRALALWRKLGDETGEAGCLINLGIAAHQRHRPRAALVSLRRALAVSHASGYRLGEASALNYLGLVHHRMGDDERAREYLNRSIARYRELGSRHGTAIGLANLGWVCQRSGRATDAVRHHEQAMVIFQQFADRYNEAEQIWALGQAYHALGRPEQARAMWHRAIATLRALRVLDDADAERLVRQEVPDTPEIIRLNT